MQYSIDYMKELELKSTLSLVREVFDEFNKEDFEDQGVENFYNYISEDAMRSRIDSGDMVVLVARTSFNQIIGTIAISSQNQVDLLFVDGEFHRKGIGTNLLKFATNVCKYNDANLEKITVNSLKYSVDFYHELGFKETDDVQIGSGTVYLPMALYVDKDIEICQSNDIEVEGENEADIVDDNQIEETPVINNENNKTENEISHTEDNSELYAILNEYYSEFDEGNRLKSTKAGILEYITTNTYIQKHVCITDRIIEIGAGTGIYSKFYAEQGNKVDAVELVDSNFKKLEKLKGDNLNVHKANATDLSMFADNTFDITLCLGPMYHLFSEEDRQKAISEAIRITKPCGKIFFSYMTNETVIINNFLKGGNLVQSKEYHDEDYIIKNDPNKVFYVSTISEMKNEIKNFGVKFLNTVAADGIASFLVGDVESLDDEEFEEWINYHLATCERKELLGYSSHILFICGKN